ncbi:MAG: hypothetical protein HOP29_19955, partial [Phycisphaerales bacterium]|nr:hypothetical protein [Phycisphaerales bacterium]
MSGRERRMAVVLGVVAGGIAVWKVGLPVVHEQLFAVEVDNKKLRGQIEELNAKLQGVSDPRTRYATYVARTGGVDAEKVKLDLHAKLNELASASGLQSPRLTPSPIADYRPAGSRRRSGIKQVEFSVTADGTLESVVEFLRAFYELPYIAQVGTLKLEPPSGRNKREGFVHFRATIEALVPPVHAVGEVNPEHITQPASDVKHRDLRYAAIWERDPFTEYVEPPPPPTPMIEEAREVVEDAPPPAPPIGDPQAGVKVIRMTLDYGTAEKRIQEAMVVNVQDQTSAYVGLGEDLDGGKVQLVSAWGVVARRESGEEFVYGIGKTLAESISFEASLGSYPEVYYAYGKIRIQKVTEMAVDAGQLTPIE